jgi:hypothetical protein
VTEKKGKAMQGRKARRERKLSVKRFKELEGKVELEWARLAIRELRLDDRIRREAMRLERNRKVDYVR